MSRIMSHEEMRILLGQRLKRSRYEHSLGVAETALKLAKRFHVDEEKAYVAGLLHDCAREFPNGELMREAEKRGIAIGPVERAMPLLLHAYIGAYRVKELYGVEDREISQAIWRHTVGGADMTPLDQIVYFADMIEPHREYPKAEQLRMLAETVSLDEMLLAGLSASILFVVQKQHLVHPDTVTARNEILMRRNAQT